MRLLGKLYLTSYGELFIHSKLDGRVYQVQSNGEWKRSPWASPLRSWRLIGDSYAKD